MVRLIRDRGGKTPIDVTTTHQDAGLRVRLTVGRDGFAKSNSDMSEHETEDLITLLQFHLAKIKGIIPNDDTD